MDSNANYVDDATQPLCPLCGNDGVDFEAPASTELIVKLYGAEMQDRVRNEFNGTMALDVCRCKRCALCFFEPRLAGSPEFYRKLHSFDWYYQQDKAEYDMAKKWVMPNTRILEVGCGAGWFRKKLPQVQYLGLEYSESAATEARAKGLEIEMTSIEEHAPSHKSCYQVVCAFQVLEHVSNPATFIAACIDCLEPGGMLIYAVPSDDSYLRYFQNAATNLPPHHITRWPDRTLEAIAELFPVDLIALEHEVLSDIHIQSCARTIVKRRLNTIFGRREEIVDRSFASRLLDRCARGLTRIVSTTFSDSEFRPRGHTVIAAYKKHGHQR